MTDYDGRKPLNIGYELVLQQRVYKIKDVIGYGGSCLVYTANRISNIQVANADASSFPVIIKEFYPYEMSHEIVRNEADIETTDSRKFSELKHDFESGAALQAAFYSQDSNHALPSAELYNANQTSYSVVELSKGVALSDCWEKLSLKEKADIIVSLCNAIKGIHDRHMLHLDIKPSNIFLFNADKGETRRIALFDFDTAINKNNTENSTIRYSPDWSAPEQRNGWKNKISFATDIYAIGVVIYWLYKGQKITVDVLNLIARNKSSFLDEIPDLAKRDKLKAVIFRILSGTTSRDEKRRFQTMSELALVSELQELSVSADDCPLIYEKLDSIEQSILKTNTSSGDEDTDYSLCNDSCNIFILKGTSFSGDMNSFSISEKNCFKYGERIEFDKEEIKRFPTLFITANDKYKKCSNTYQHFYYGKVESVRRNGRNIEVVFKKLFNKPMSQNKLNKIAEKIGINVIKGCDLLTETNWLLLHVDIRRLLIENDLQYK